MVTAARRTGNAGKKILYGNLYAQKCSVQKSSGRLHRAVLCLAQVESILYLYYCCTVARTVLRSTRVPYRYVLVVFSKKNEMHVMMMVGWLMAAFFVLEGK